MEAASRGGADASALQFATRPPVMCKTKRRSGDACASSPQSAPLSMLLSAAASERERADGTRPASTSGKRQRRANALYRSSAAIMRASERVAESPTHSRTDGSSVASDDVEQSKSSKRKYRKGTNTLRKEEKHRLVKELEELEQHLEVLKKRASAIQSYETPVDFGSMVALQTLRDRVLAHQFEYGSVMSLMSDYNLCNLEGGNPIHEPIHLPYERDDRIGLLKKSRARRLRRAKQFFESRRPNLDACSVVREEHRFETSTGDFCASRFSAFHFKGIYSTQRVFDLLRFYMSNVEISMTEKMGYVTIRENEDGSIEGITQNRLVSMLHSGAKMESNSILFSQFKEADADFPGSSEYGVIVIDSVDSDEKYPYYSANRVRKEIAAVMEVRSHTKRSLGLGASDERVTVLTRWMYSKLRRPGFPISAEDWIEMRDAMDRWGRSIQQTLMESLFPETEMVGQDLPHCGPQV